MTSKAVRDDMKAQWPVRVGALSLIDDINLDPKDITELPTEWARFGFAASSDEPVCLGAENARWRETGQINIRIFVKSGSGSGRALTLAEQVKSAWVNYVGLAGNFHIVNIAPPLDLSDGESDGEWYSLQLAVAYFCDSFK